MEIFLLLQICCIWKRVKEMSQKYRACKWLKGTDCNKGEREPIKQKFHMIPYQQVERQLINWRKIWMKMFAFMKLSSLAIMFSILRLLQTPKHVPLGVKGLKLFRQSNSFFRSFQCRKLKIIILVNPFPRTTNLQKTHLKKNSQKCA